MKENEYTLQLPNNYVEMDRYEMEYVDSGGWQIYTTGESLSNFSILLERYVNSSRALTYSVIILMNDLKLA